MAPCENRHFSVCLLETIGLQQTERRKNSQVKNGDRCIKVHYFFTAPSWVKSSACSGTKILTSLSHYSSTSFSQTVTKVVSHQAKIVVRELLAAAVGFFFITI